MKAAVVFQAGEMPQYVDLPEPIAQNEGEEVAAVKAVAIKHFDKQRAAGKHYSSGQAEKGRVIGGDGICTLADGTKVYAIGMDGMLAERAIINKDRTARVPEGLDDAVAAALPNAVIGSAMALKFKADVQQGDTVLINGATGFTGRVAVQIAKYYGAGKVIATGRNPKSLEKVRLLGADQTVSLLQDDKDIKSQLADIHASTPIDVVIDYLWGHTAEMILACLKGNGFFTNRVRYVSVGSATGDLIQLSAANLRSVDLQLSGSGLGAWPKPQVGKIFSEILPEMFGLAAAGKLKVETENVRLENISELWNLDVPDGKRLVVMV